MSQLITTSNISSIRPVFKDEPAENIKRYIQIKKIFEANGEYNFFAEPVIAAGQKISWHTEYEGKIQAYAKLSDEEKQTTLSILKNQVNKIYKAILAYTEDERQRKNLFELIDYCIEIPSYDDIYIVQNSNGKRNFCIVNWGFIMDNFNAPTGLIAKLIPLKVADLSIKVIKGNNKIAVNQSLNIVISNNDKLYTTDENGKIFINDISLNSNITIYNIDEKNNRKNEENFLLEDDLEIIYNIEKDNLPKQEVMIQTIDEKDNILPNVNVKIKYEDVEFISETDKEGKLFIGELYTETQVSCTQISNGKEIKKEQFSVKQGKQIYFIYLISETQKGPATINIINENRKPIPFANIQVKSNDGVVKNYTADENGTVTIDMLKYKEDLVVRQIIDNSAQFQRIIKFTQENNTAEFIGKEIVPNHLFSKVHITLLDNQNQPVPNLIVMLENGLKTHNFYSNDQGVATFENINCAEPTKAIVEYKGKKYEKIIDCSQGKTELTMKLSSGMNLKWLWWLLLGILLLGLIYLLTTIDYKKIFPQKDNNVVITDTVVVEKPKTGMIINVVDTNNSAISNANVIVSFNDSTFSFKTDEKGQVQIEKLTDTTKNVLIKVFSKGFQPTEQTFRICKHRKIVLSNISQEITETIYPCGTTIKSAGYRSTIKTFKMPSNKGIVGISYDMYQIADRIIIYNGPVWTINTSKIIWESPKFQSNYHAININYESVDSLITVEIKGGDTTRTEWYFKVWCQAIPMNRQTRDTTRTH